MNVSKPVTPETIRAIRARHKGHPRLQQVIRDLKERSERGRLKYGTELMTHNGRDATQDMYEELLDASEYGTQRVMEEPAIELICWQANLIDNLMRVALQMPPRMRAGESLPTQPAPVTTR